MHPFTHQPTKLEISKKLACCAQLCHWKGLTPPFITMQACYAAASLAELKDSLGSEYSSISVIAIDEAQFLPDLLQFCTHAADHDHKQILVAGLDGDFRRHRFGQVGCRSPPTGPPLDLHRFKRILEGHALGL